MSSLTVLSCLPDAVLPGRAEAQGHWLRSVDAILGSSAGHSYGHSVGPRPGKLIDPLLVGRVLVIGDDADLAAVLLRLLRTEKLGTVEIAYVSRVATPLSTMHRLPTGSAALPAAGRGQVEPVTLIRDDSGGVLAGQGDIAPITALVYADEHRLLAGPARRLRVRPDVLGGEGLTVTLTGRRRFGVFSGRPDSTAARAVQVTGEPMTPLLDGVAFPRQVDTWIWYRHVEPWLLITG